MRFINNQIIFIMKTLISYTILSLVFYSCGNPKLKREIAEEVIKKDFQEYCFLQEQDIHTVISENRNSKYPNYNYKKNWLGKISDEEYNELYSQFVNIEKKELLVLFQNHTKPDPFGGIGYFSRIKLSDKAKDIYNITRDYIWPITFLEFKMIKGISETSDNNEATVMCEFNIKPTDFYYLVKDNKKLTCSLGSVERELVLVKYDTGWRLKK